MAYWDLIISILSMVAGLTVLAVMVVVGCRIQQARRLSVEADKTIQRRLMQERTGLPVSSKELQPRGAIQSSKIVSPRPTPRRLTAIEDLSRPIEDVVEEAEQKAVQQWNKDYPNRGW
jgi:hypothetical protein